MMSATLKTVYFLGLLAEILIRLPHERRRRQTRMAVDRVTTLERLLVASLSVGLFFIPAVYVLTPWLNWAGYRLYQGARDELAGLVLLSLSWRCGYSGARTLTSGATGRPRSKYAKDTPSLPKASTDQSGTRCTLRYGFGA